MAHEARLVTHAERRALSSPWDFDPSEESVSRWMCQAHIDDAIKGGLTTAEESRSSSSVDLAGEAYLPQRSLLASAAPSANDFSFAHCTSGCTLMFLHPCENPQSVPAMTFSFPTTLA